MSRRKVELFEEASWVPVICCVSSSLGSTVFLSQFISFSLALALISAISNTVYLINIIAVTVTNFLFPSDRFLSDNPISSTGTRLFSISNQHLFV